VVQTAAKLVLEPIFEADFDASSFGFRRKKDAHQALDAIREALWDGMHWVIDADITAYFDSIPHDKLMKTVAQRVVDGAMLALVKKFLEAPIVDERDGGRPRRNCKGTPQGGVISPLLANIYLHLMDRNFRKHVEAKRLRGRLVRYADDFLLLAPKPPQRERAWLGRFLGRLDLELHPTKTRVLDARTTSFDFLGHTVWWRSRGFYLDISKKAQERIRDALRKKTRQMWLGLEELVQDLNAYIRGARQYFRRVVRRRLLLLDYFAQQRIARWAGRKHARRLPTWSLVCEGRIWREHGLERWDPLARSTPAPSRTAW
jgi:group II intron reverse transcriptase/maturase